MEHEIGELRLYYEGLKAPTQARSALAEPLATEVHGITVHAILASAAVHCATGGGSVERASSGTGAMDARRER